jgi:hypothetical protein
MIWCYLTKIGLWQWILSSFHICDDRVELACFRWLQQSQCAFPNPKASTRTFIRSFSRSTRSIVGSGMRCVTLL